MFIDKFGSIGIGTTNPDEELTVNGTIHSKEVKVDNSILPPDYVFEANAKSNSKARAMRAIYSNNYFDTRHKVSGS